MKKQLILSGLLMTFLATAAFAEDPANSIQGDQSGQSAPAAGSSAPAGDNTMPNNNTNNTNNNSKDSTNSSSTGTTNTPSY